MPLLRSQSSSWSQSFLYLNRQVWGSSNRRTRTLAPLHQLGTWSYGNNSIQRRTAAGLSNTTSSHTRTSTTNSVVGTTIDFFQYAICPFCNKTKAFLNYAGVKYNAIEVNPLTKAEIRWSTDYRKVPLARALLFVNAKEENDDDINNNKNNKSVVVWKGSDEIIHGLLQQDWVKQKLEEKWQSSSTTTTSDKNQIPTTTPADDDSATSKTKRTTMIWKEFGPESESSQYWVTYANQELAVLLYPNLCPTLYDSYQAFAYINDDTNQFSYWQKLSIRLVGSLAMYLAASRVKRTYHNKDFTHFLVVVSIEFILVVLEEYSFFPTKSTEINQQCSPPPFFRFFLRLLLLNSPSLIVCWMMMVVLYCIVSHKWFFLPVFLLSFVFLAHTGKHKIVDEREALARVLQKPVQHLQPAENDSAEATTTTTTSAPRHSSSSSLLFLSGGEEPHLGDLAVFGALRGIQGTKIHTECLETEPILKEWYYRMEQKVAPTNETSS